MPPKSQEARKSANAGRSHSGASSNSTTSDEEEESNLTSPRLSALEKQKKEFIRRAMVFVDKVIDTQIEAYVKSHGAGSSSASESGLRAGRFSGNSRRESPQKSRKRQQRDESPDGDKENNNGNDKGSKRVKKSPKTGRKFACPVFQNDPSSCTSRACLGPGWEDLHRLKEHLYRCHLAPKYECFRCGETFDQTPQFAAHSRAQIQCEVVADSVAKIKKGRIIDTEKKAKLQARGPRGEDVMSNVDKWKAIYKIIYPSISDEDMPSPYYAPDSKKFEDFVKYLRQEMPLRVKRMLIDKMNERADNFTEEMKGFVLDLARMMAIQLAQQFNQAASPSVLDDPPEDEGQALSLSPAGGTADGTIPGYQDHILTSEYSGDPGLDQDFLLDAVFAMNSVEFPTTNFEGAGIDEEGKMSPSFFFPVS